ncbi:MAG: FapA family protein [Capsulimonas sp.]|uniref:FapA family protein n=1 Tax=Capsulimonas sp. TaxID=2494211 RepID=UPI0032654C4C
MEKSLVVQGRTIEAALERASVLLHCAPHRVAYEMLKKADPAHGVLYKLRVTEVAHAIAELTPNDDQGLEFGSPMPWFAGMLAPLAPDAFCKSLDEAFNQALEEQPTSTQEPSQAAIHQPPLNLLEGVHLATGNIDHPGDVHIHGDIAKGMRIQAAGSIHVLGDVENAFLEAGGDIVVTGGFFGSAHSTHGRISCKFLQGAQLEAPRGAVVVQENSMHSHLVAGKSAIIRGSFVGGSCYGHELVEARSAGSEHGVPTVLIAGHNKHFMDRVDAIRLRAERNVRLLGECQRLRDALLPIEQAGDELPIEDRVRLWTAAIRKGRIHADLMRLSAEKSAALGMINKNRTARVSVTDKIFPKVKVLVDDAPLEVRAVTQFVSFTKDYEAGTIRVTPYQ